MKAVLKFLTLQTRKGASTPIAITATSGSGQSASVTAAYAAPLVATITPALSGVSVTFTAPASGASGTFASTGTRTETVVTNGSGVATSSAFTANNTDLGVAYTVTATAGALSCNFSLQNIGYVSTILTTTPNGFWPLMETAGSVVANVSAAGAAYNGTPTGIVWADTAGPGASMGNAPFFDGLDDYIDVFSAVVAAAFTTSIHTLSIWIKMAANEWTTTTQRLAIGCTSAGANYTAIYKSTSTGTFTWDANGVVRSKGSIADYAWIHVLLERNGTTLKGYWNGAQSGADLTITNWATGELTTFPIGTSGAHTSLFWKGWLAHAAWWNRVLTPAEKTLVATAR